MYTVNFIYAHHQGRLRFSRLISTENVACKLTDSVFRSLNQKRHVRQFFCNLSKAFYCKKHEILL